MCMPNACCSWRWAAATTTLIHHCELPLAHSFRSPFVPPPCAGMRCSMRALLLCAALAVLCACSLPLASGWKPRSLPRTAAAAGAPRHRFFLPNPCVLNDERTGAHYDLTSLRKTGSVKRQQTRGACAQADTGAVAAVTRDSVAVLDCHRWRGPSSSSSAITAARYVTRSAAHSPRLVLLVSFPSSQLGLLRFGRRLLLQDERVRSGQRGRPLRKRARLSVQCKDDQLRRENRGVRRLLRAAPHAPRRQQSRCGSAGALFERRYLLPRTH